MALIHLLQAIRLRAIAPKFQTASASTANNNDNNQPKNPCDEDKKAEEPDDDPQIINVPTAEDIRRQQLQRCKIVIREPDNYFLISGVPVQLTCSRTARIHQPTKTAAQSGTLHLGTWDIDFATKERWENPLMGWIGSGDALSNLKLRFSTKEEAIGYCQKNNMQFWVQETNTKKKKMSRNYGLNFHYKNRTRQSTR